MSESRWALWWRRAERGVIGVAGAVALALLVACGSGGGGVADAEGKADPAAAPAAAPAPAEAQVVLVMGDSLSAAYNLAPEQGWVALVDADLRARGLSWRMVNASISGETTAGGATRIAQALAEHRPGVVVIELGANDGLRGLPLEESRRNLEAMVRAAKASGARVLLVGMRLPPNYGPDYTEGFFAMFGEIARAEGTALLPFLLEPIAMDDAAFQADRLHPTAEAQPALAAHVWSALGPLLDPPPAP